MSNYIFEENNLLGITNIYQKEKNILLGFIHHDLKKFIYTHSPTIKVISNKVKKFEIKKEIDVYEKELDSLSKLFPNKQRKRDLIFDIKNNKGRLENLKDSDSNFLDVGDLAKDLESKGIEFFGFNQGYALLPKEYSFNNTEVLIKERDLNHIWDMNYFTMYNLLSVKEYKYFLGTRDILSKNFINTMIKQEKVEIIDIKFDYNFFMNDKEQKLKLVEKGLKSIMHDKEVFKATIEFYTNSFINFNYLVGIYDGLPFIIKDNILFTNPKDEDSFNKYSTLMFNISIYSK